MVLPEPRPFVGVPHGQKQNDPIEERKILSGSEDPVADGVVAPLGSLFLRDNGSLYRKTGAANTAWTEITTAVDSFATMAPGVGVEQTPFQAVDPATTILTLGPFAVTAGMRSSVEVTFTMGPPAADATVGFQWVSALAGAGPLLTHVVPSGDTHTVTVTLPTAYAVPGNETWTFVLDDTDVDINVQNIFGDVQFFPAAPPAGA